MMQVTVLDSLQFLNIGYGNLVMLNRVIAVVSPESAPIKRIVQEAKEKGVAVDATCGRKTRGVLIMDNGQVILSALVPETIGSRIADRKETGCRYENKE